jgi:DHA1 family multidrug resistance protein-like MFS transporter
VNSVLPPKRQLAIIYACVFVVMIGFGLTLPVLAFYIERLALAEGATSQQASAHVGALTGIFALMQFFFAPLWGRLSDRAGRRPLFLIGLNGYAISMALFGMGTNLAMLYAARILGGMLSSAVLPAASAYVADLTAEKERGRGMAWLGSAIGLGVVVGPGIGALLSRLEWHLTFRFGHFSVDDFSTPFFAAALLALFTLLAGMRWLPESLAATRAKASVAPKLMPITLPPPSRWWFMQGPLGELLGLALLSQFALALFEGTFALHAKQTMNFSPSQMAAIPLMGTAILIGRKTWSRFALDK